MTRAYSYIRYSTPQQSVGDSLRRQLDRTATYCREQGLELDESLSDEGLSGAGIAVVTLVDGQRFDASIVDANVGQLFLSIGMMMGAHAESKNKGMRVKAAHRANRAKPSDTCPAWIRQNPATETGYEVIPECQKIIDRIFRECIEGIGLERIAAGLNRDGIPTFATRKRKRSGWYNTYLRTVIVGRAARSFITRSMSAGNALRLAKRS
jgi:DNA invertase Pin-like site-specific DNA recombinase